MNDMEEDAYYGAPQDPQIADLEYKLDNSRGFTIALYEELTSKDPIDLGKVQFFMSELSSYLDFKDEDFGPLTIERKL